MIPAVPKPQPWSLEILSGADRGKKYLISKPSIKIGRDKSNQVVLTDLKVSRTHIQFEARDGRVLLTNLSPNNPIYLDDVIVAEAEYLPGQVLRMGETTLTLKKQAPAPATKPTQQAAPKIPSPGPPKSKAPMIALIAVLGLMIYLITGEESPKETFEVSTISDIEQIVEESRQRQRELKEQRSFASLPERKGFEAAERHYNQGFRDFQRGNYTRAIQSFRAALASDRNHDLALRYHRLSERKLQELVDQSLLEGRRHYEKGMFSMCEAAMAKVLVLINDKDDLKYQQADELRQECFLSKSVM